MTYQPVIPMGGMVGWTFLNATLDSQRQSFDSAPRISRDTAYFEQQIGQITSAEDLVADRRLLRVALGAFGLQDDIDNRFLIRKILEGGTTDSDALANKMSDARYKELADAFGFADRDTPHTQDEEFGTKITAAYRTRMFEVAVGEQDQALRLAMNAERELLSIVSGGDDDDDDTRWLRIMGSPPLRQVFETAFGLPDGFAQLDIDKQLEVFQERAASQIGINNLTDLADDGLRKKLVERFLLRDQVAAMTSMSSTSIALTLLRSAPPAF